MRLPFSIPKDWLCSFLLALGLHAVFFLGSGFAFFRPAQFGVEASTGGIEISMIAALPAAVRRPDAVKAAVLSAAAGEFASPSEPKKKAASKKQAVVNKTPDTGDGSSKIPGKSKTTFYSQGGGSADAKAGYLKNPPPLYPQAAIERGLEGLVLLSVQVDASGHPENVAVKKGSGFRVLDEAALKAVRRWKFDPAQAGLLGVSSQLDVPIRFVLEDRFKKTK